MAQRNLGSSLAELRNEALLLDTAEVRPIMVSPYNAEEKGFKAIWNNEQEQVATIVSDRYNLVQHRQVIHSVIDAISGLNLKATGQIGNAGNRVFVDINFTDSKLYAQQGEEFIAGVRIINSYNCTTGIMVLPHLMRLACSNGMVVNVRWVQAFNIRHTEKLAKDFQATIEKMIKDMVNGNEKLKALINDCIKDSIEWQSMVKILAKLLTGREKHIEAIKAIMTAKGTEKPLTRWDLYNAFTDYATHGQQLRPNVENWLQNKAQKLLITPLAQLMPVEQEA